MSGHAPFGPSGLDALERCPGKWQAEQGVEDPGSVYAAEGTRKHGLAEAALLAGTNADDEMVQAYLDYVRELGCETLEAEVKVKPIPHMVDLIWGTADFIGVNGDVLHVADLKTGAGVPVYADDNLQGVAYALGGLNEMEMFGPFKTVKFHIVQPALDNYDVAEYPVENLLAYVPRIEKIIATAQATDAQRIPNDKSCRFCRVKATCYARAEANLALARHEFAEPKDLTLEEIAEILPQARQLSKWASDIEEFALKEAEKGVHIQRHKLVEGRSNRTYIDAAAVAERLHGADIPDTKIYKPRAVLGITEMEKGLGKKVFAELLGEMIVKPRGKPVLVADSDSRPAISGMASAVADFSEE